MRANFLFTDDDESNRWMRALLRVSADARESTEDRALRTPLQWFCTISPAAKQAGRTETLNPRDRTCSGLKSHHQAPLRRAIR